MNELSREIKTHVAITYAGGHYFITSEQEEMINGRHKTIKFLKTDNIRLDGCTVRISNISETPTVEKYYEIYPAKKPVNGYINFSFKKVKRPGLSEDRRREIYRQNILDLKNRFSEKEMPQGARELIQRMEEVIKNMEKK